MWNHFFGEKFSDCFPESVLLGSKERTRANVSHICNFGSWRTKRGWWLLSMIVRIWLQLLIYSRTRTRMYSTISVEYKANFLKTSNTSLMSTHNDKSLLFICLAVVMVNWLVKTTNPLQRISWAYLLLRNLVMARIRE
jgi:hypothetical protein